MKTKFFPRRLCRIAAAATTMAVTLLPVQSRETGADPLSKLREQMEKTLQPGVKQSADRAVRYVPGKEQSVLQVPQITFEGPGGQKVELTGAIHIGDKEYYERLNEHFKSFDCVLFEMVADPEGIEALRRGERKSPKPGQEEDVLSLLYRTMAEDILHLASQGAVMDYSSPHFVHADMSKKEFEAALAEKNLTTGDLMGNLKPAQMKMALGLIKAFLPSDDPHAAKRFLAPLFGMAAVGMFPEQAITEIVIDARNVKVMEVFDREIAAGKKNLAVFYGAGHFQDLVKRLESRGWKKTGETWDDAWVIPAAGKAGKAAAAGEAPAAPQVLTADAKELLERTMKPLREARTLSVRTKSTVDLPIPGLAGSMESDGVMRTREPACLFLEAGSKSGPGGTLVSDGTTLRIYDKVSNRYIERPAPSDPEQISSMPELQVIGLSGDDDLIPLLDFSAAKDPLAAIRSARIDGRETIGGEECIRLELTGPVCPFRVWITGGSDPRLRRITIGLRHLAAKMLPGIPSEDNSPMAALLKGEAVIDLSDWEVNGELTDEAFRFTLPEGAVKVDAF